jgi:hypothetical protein
MFDVPSAEFFYRRCQELGVELVVVSRHAAGACPVPRSMYDSIAETKHPVALRLRAAQRFSIVGLWKRACAPEGSDGRLNLPARCSREWFLNTFCKGKSLPEGSADEDVWNIVATFNMYDTLALVASVPELREIYFDCLLVPSYPGGGDEEEMSSSHKGRKKKVVHSVIGVGAQEHGIKDKVSLQKFMVKSFKHGIITAKKEDEGTEGTSLYKSRRRASFLLSPDLSTSEER